MRLVVFFGCYGYCFWRQNALRVHRFLRYRTFEDRDIMTLESMLIRRCENFIAHTCRRKLISARLTTHYEW